MRTLPWLIVSLLLASAPRPAGAHGARVETVLTRTVRVELEVQVQATFHSGRPMAGATVRVLAPGHDDSPWTVGTCDADGRFVFRPPPERTGAWEVQVMHQGHGATVRLDVEDPADGSPAGADVPGIVRVEAGSSPHLSAAQRVVMGGCVVWGLLGTALFFRRRRV